MNKLILSIFIIFGLTAAPTTIIFGQKSAATTQTNTSSYGQITGSKTTIAAKSEFISLYKTNGKLYLELPLTYLDRDMLISTAITKSTNTDWNSVGNKMEPPIHVRFSLENGDIYLREVNSKIVYDKSDPLLTKAVKATYMDKYIGNYKIEAKSPNGSSVVIDVTDVFAGDKKEFAPVTARFNAAKTSFNRSLSYPGEIKAFEDNALIKSILSYDYQMNNNPSEKSVWSMEITRSILLLPEEPMKPRIADSRLGFFSQSMLEIDYTQSDRLTRYDYVQRWRLEPKDPAAWERGELVEPVKPLVYYVDNAFPESWKPGIKRGILAWNEAFEKIGFKNVMNVLDFPTDDPDFDPDNLKYSCLRYVPTSVESARGPGWVDPRSGEFLNGCVMVWGNLNNSMGKRRLIETAHLDPHVRSLKMPDDITEHAFFDIISHEIGHTLGLAHNMAGSAAFPVDSLRSATFTNKYGVTASIMDYIHYNYVAQPEDKGVMLHQHKVGVYDEFYIKYAYSPIPGNLSVKQELAVLEKWVDEKAGDPMYRYGVQQWTPIYDPSTLINDLGDDPVKAGDYSIKNLKVTLASLQNWFPNPEDLPEVYDIYNRMVEKYKDLLKFVSYNVGGMYLTRVKPGTKGDTFKAVPKETQQQSVQWILNEVKNCDWVDHKELTSKFSLSLKKSVDVKKEGMKALLAVSDHVVLASHISGDPYTIEMYYDDIYQGVWDATIKNKKLNETDKIMQRMFINALYSETKPATGIKKVFDQTALDGGMESNLLHFNRLEAETAFELIPNQGAQSRVDVSNISDKKGAGLLMLEKIKKLVQSKINTANADDIAHYKTVLNAL